MSRRFWAIVERRRGRHPAGATGRRVTPQRPARAIEAVWRLESARIVAGLARLVRDVGLAEELAQDALVAALEQWPAVGRAGQPRRLADADRQAPRHRPAAPRRPARRASSSELGHDAGPRAEPTRAADFDAGWTTASATTCCG